MITLFSKPGCPNCVAAKSLLQSKNISFEEITLDVGQDKDPAGNYVPVAEFKAAHPTVRMMPYMLDDGKPLGGYQELLARAL